jgi:hypothetical protein
MIKFFRKIRQRLLSDGKFSKYLLYAIGEIVLVVIGILIALQINNWNEARKNRDLEIKTLSELEASFEKDLNDIEYNLQLHNRGLIACKKLLMAIEENIPYHDSLDQYFGQFSNVSVFINSTGAYETLKSRGIDIIRNDTLRRQIIDMHDITYHYMIVNQNEFDLSDLRENKQFMLEHMTEWKFFESAKPKDYKWLLRKQFFRNRLEYTSQVREISVRVYHNAAENCKRVIANIKSEIEMLRTS